MRAVYFVAGAAAGAGTALRSIVAKGETATRLRERQGLWTGQREPARPWIWIQAASVGEAEIAVALARATAAKRPDLRLVVSSMTATGVARVRREHGIESR